MSNIFNTALAEGMVSLYSVFGEQFYARPPTGFGESTIGPFSGIFSAITADSVETESGYVRIQSRTLTTSLENAAVILRSLEGVPGGEGRIEDPQGVVWRIRKQSTQDAVSRTFDLWRTEKNG